MHAEFTLKLTQIWLPNLLLGTNVNHLNTAYKRTVMDSDFHMIVLIHMPLCMSVIWLNTDTKVSSSFNPRNWCSWESAILQNSVLVFTRKACSLKYDLEMLSPLQWFKKFQHLISNCILNEDILNVSVKVIKWKRNFPCYISICSWFTHKFILLPYMSTG